MLLPIEQAPVNGRCDSTLGPWARQPRSDDGLPIPKVVGGGHPQLHDQGLCRAHDSGNRKLISRSPAQRTGPHCCLLDDRQRAWRHLLHLRGELSTALASPRLGGVYVAGCADPPSGLKCRMEAGGMDRETAESVAGVARLPATGRVAGLGQGRSGRSVVAARRLDHLFVALDGVERTQAVSLHAQSARVMIIMENSATEMIFTPRWYTVAQVAQLLTMGRARFACAAHICHTARRPRCAPPPDHANPSARQRRSRWRFTQMPVRLPHARHCGDLETSWTEILLYFAAVLAARTLRSRISMCI